jgi:hypothetical protein
MKKPTCKTCPYYYEGLRYSECRRHPPEPWTEICDRDDHPVGVHRGKKVSTHSESWCGEHPDFRYWEAYQKGTLRWVLWTTGNREAPAYLHSVTQTKYSSSTTEPQEAKLFTSLEEAQSTADLVHKDYYEDNVKFHPIPVIISLAEGTWRD